MKIHKIKISTSPITISRDAELVDLMYRYARENLALVNVYIKDPAVTQVRTSEHNREVAFFLTCTFRSLTGEARPEGTHHLVHRQHRGHPGPVHGLQPRHHLRDTPPRRHCRIQGGRMQSSI